LAKEEGGMQNEEVVASGPEAGSFCILHSAFCISSAPGGETGSRLAYT
jgi:hypothetical protein